MMVKMFYNYFVILCVAGTLTGCVTPFTPTGIATMGGGLVVEGDIILNDETQVFLSYSKALDDDGAIKYITNATVWVESANKQVYKGVVNTTQTPPCYVVATSGLDLGQQYKLCVDLPDGSRYESVLLTPLIAPPIDSIGYIVDDSRTFVDFYVNTHGDNHASRYYKWRFSEDWEFTAKYRTKYYYDLSSNQILPYDLDPSPVYYCWNSAESTSILVAKADHLENNVIYEQMLTTIPDRSDKISYLYSMGLYQMSISKDAYTYWATLKKNTDEVGGIFAPQPSEMHGNIYCISNPEEKVLGYVSAGVIAFKRVFVSGSEIGIYLTDDCQFFDPNEGCPPGIPLTNLQTYELGNLVVRESARDAIKWASSTCVDCRTRGTKNKPPYWPNDDY